MKEVSTSTSNVTTKIIYICIYTYTHEKRIGLVSEVNEVHSGFEYIIPQRAPAQYIKS